MHLRKYFVSTLQMAEGRILNIDISLYVLKKTEYVFYYKHLSYLLSYYQVISDYNATLYECDFLNF